MAYTVFLTANRRAVCVFRSLWSRADFLPIAGTLPPWKDAESTRDSSFDQEFYSGTLV